MNLAEYINNLNNRYKAGNATEHTYRGDLQLLLESMLSGVMVTNEPSRIECGAPDYILTKNNLTLGYIEAKNIDIDLQSKSLKEQFDRYRNSLGNLIFTDYLTFRLYIEGEYQTEVRIGEVHNGKVVALKDNFDKFTDLISSFVLYKGQLIKSPQKLAEMMAAKAILLAEVIATALTSDESSQQNSSLIGQMQGFKTYLIHDIDNHSFADIYAQTIAYGMFAARLHDTSLDSFSRQEAAELIPRSNPFLRSLFSYIAGPDIDQRIVWIVDSLAEIFRATDIKELLTNFGKATKTHDPIIHFYETFLAAYNPALRKARGVWYTPEPVVNFIVRAVDDILKSEFDLPEGLADTTMTKVKYDTQNFDKKGKPIQAEKEIHKVQILDPATGTGTFLAEVIKQVHAKFAGQQGLWSGYVEKHLIPRLNGFELLMASYAMAHLKLDMLLAETGYHAKYTQRLKVYLTNSLEESHPDTGTLFASWLSSEANEANGIKRDAPVMVVIGNPPYSGESANKGDWIMGLMEDYKKEPGGTEKLQERNPKWINDDYVKFIRYGQHFIEKNGEGILAFINPHGFLDNPTFRGMRWHLLKTYDKIYTLDLHGNSNQHEICPDGSPDINVFDIQQGVSINFFVKTGKKKAGELGKVYHCDLYGKREVKYDFLFENSVSTIKYNELPNIAPNYFFVSKDFDTQKIYDFGFSVNELFVINNVGIVTAKDAVLIKDTDNDLVRSVEDYYKITVNKQLITKLSYRPFDTKLVYYDIKLIERARDKTMQHFLRGENIGLVTARSNKSETCDHFWISKNIMEAKCGERTTQSAIFPLYLYPANTMEGEAVRVPNLKMEIVNQIADGLGLQFVPEKTGEPTTFAPIDLLDYIYAVLHSPTYREKYKEFLKIDFPRVPYPKNAATFWQLVKLGGELRAIHLLEKKLPLITNYPMDGNNVVAKIKYDCRGGVFPPDATPSETPTTGRVFINESQYFDKVPQIAWEFYIGGYQPAQKWLKDRKDRELSYEDIRHYQNIIAALARTEELMREIDLVDVEGGE